METFIVLPVAMERSDREETTSSPIRVLIADDHPVTRAGVRDRLEEASDVTVVGEAESGHKTLELSHQKHPDVLLLDVVMPDGSGLEVAERLVTLTRAPRILVLSAYNNPEYIRHLMEHGANGYLTKDQVPTHIIEAVRAVAQGDGRWFVPSVPTADTLKSRLTDREQEVLRALAEGHSNKELADVLNVSKNTIRTHTSHLYDKLDVASAREAISLAWQSGFMRVE